MFDRMFRCDPDVVIARQDRGKQTLGESRISALGGIMTGISLTSDNLSVIDPDRLELLGRAANIRMRDMKPFNWNLSRPWPDVFTGTVDGRRAVAIANDSDQWKEYRFDEIALDPAQDAEEILHPSGKRKYTVAVAPHDAVLLVQ
jgi:alpha-galactosidase